MRISVPSTLRGDAHFKHRISAFIPIGIKADLFNLFIVSVLEGVVLNGSDFHFVFQLFLKSFDFPPGRR